MKVGLSYSRCMFDIVTGKVDFDDVLVIISRTNFDPENDEHWAQIYNGYLFGGHSVAHWSQLTKDKLPFLRPMTIRLHKAGKLHQPRQFGTRPLSSRYTWLETVLPSEELNNHPVVGELWEQFCVAASLSDIKLDRQIK